MAQGKMKWGEDSCLLLRAVVFLLNVVYLNTVSYGLWKPEKIMEKWTLNDIEELYSSHALHTVKWEWTWNFLSLFLPPPHLRKEQDYLQVEEKRIWSLQIEQLIFFLPLDFS